MSNKKISVEDKIYAVKLHLNGIESKYGIVAMFNVNKASVLQWIRNYAQAAERYQASYQQTRRRLKLSCG